MSWKFWCDKRHISSSPFERGSPLRWSSEVSWHLCHTLSGPVLDLPLSACISCPGDKCVREIFTPHFYFIQIMTCRLNIHYMCVTICEHKPWPCFESFRMPCPSFCSAVVHRLQYLRWTSVTPGIWDGFWQHTRGHWCKQDFDTRHLY